MKNRKTRKVVRAPDADEEKKKKTDTPLLITAPLLRVAQRSIEERKRKAQQ